MTQFNKLKSSVATPATALPCDDRSASGARRKASSQLCLAVKPAQMASRDTDDTTEASNFSIQHARITSESREPGAVNHRQVHASSICVMLEVWLRCVYTKPLTRACAATGRFRLVCCHDLLYSSTFQVTPVNVVPPTILVYYCWEPLRSAGQLL